MVTLILAHFRKNGNLYLQPLTTQRCQIDIFNVKFQKIDIIYLALTLEFFH
jgi:hypothetical protein